MDVKTGEVFAHCKPCHRQKEFLEFLRHIERTTPAHLAIHVVADNYAAHKTSAVRQWLLRHPRWQLHFIPTHSSWLNQVERFFAKITLEVIRRGSFTSVPHLRKSILDYVGAYDKAPQPFVWTANAERIFEKIEKVLWQTSLTQHQEIAFSGCRLPRRPTPCKGISFPARL